MRRFFRRLAPSRRRVGIVLAAALLAAPTSVAATTGPSERTAAAAQTSGYWLVGTDGGIFSFGKAAFYGSTGAVKLNQPIVGMAATPDGKGYWMVAADGGIFSFGSAGFYGSTGAVKLNQPIVGMAATRTGKGYWLVASDGGIFAFGDAGFFGSTGNVKLNRPIVDIVPTPTGRGYWMAASDGGIFSFGDAGFFGSTGAVKLAKRIQQMATTPTGKGYWLVAGDGGIFAFGDAKFHGSAADGGPEKRIVDMAPSATGNGYYLTASNGAVYHYGDATPYGGLEKHKLAHGIIAMVALNGGEPPVAVDDVLEISEDGSGSIDVLANDRDPDGTPLTLQSISGSTRAAITASGGTVTYKPNPDFNGNDSFTYTVADERQNTATATVSVRIRAIDDLPRTTEDTVTAPIAQAVTINVLGNDSGLGDGFRLLEIATPPSRGTATLTPDGRGVIYTGNKRGSDTVRYRVWDNDNDNADGMLRITVSGADLQPNAVKIDRVCNASTDCKVDVLSISGVALGDNGRVRIVDESNDSRTIPGVGTFTRQGTVISFVRQNGFFGPATVQYEIVDDNDGNGTPQVSTADLTFDYQNTPPTAQPGADSVPVDTAKDFQLAGNDPEGAALSFLIDSIVGPAPDPGSYFQFSGGAFHFNGGPAGTWTITFRVFDGTTASEPATFTITVG
ncbi:MAG TPA: cadherin-like domain-containing protein [Acidimicrobiia bacterium]|nr:cadherin-like domain-containing protein [Acidimicrobiia bacterium]